jgi:hypothetical protein
LQLLETRHQKLEHLLDVKAKEFDQSTQTTKLEMRALEQKLETLEKINVHLQV